MNYKAALFDMDGVILDSEPLHFAAFKKTLQDHGKNLSDEEYKQFFAGRTDEYGFKRYFDFINETVNLSMIISEKSQNYLQLASGHLTTYPGVVKLIQDLARKMPLALVTESLSIEAKTTTDALGITDCFQAVICAEDIKRSKPDPEGYLKASEVLGIKNKDCVVVEDTPSGVLAAFNAGIACIAVTFTHSPNELAMANKIVDSLQLDLF